MTNELSFTQVGGTIIYSDYAHVDHPLENDSIKEALDTKEALVAKIALTTLPAKIRTIAQELTVETLEPPFYENKYDVGSVRTYRTLCVRFSEHSDQILANENLVNALKKVENTGFHVPSEKLFNLRENVEDEWKVQFEGMFIKFLIKPLQQELCSLAPSIIQNVPFEDAFQAQLQ